MAQFVKHSIKLFQNWIQNFQWMDQTCCCWDKWQIDYDVEKCPIIEYDKKINHVQSWEFAVFLLDFLWVKLMSWPKNETKETLQVTFSL